MAHNITDQEWQTAHNACARLNYYGGSTYVDGERIKPYEQRPAGPPPECESLANHLDAAAGLAHPSKERIKALIVRYDATSREQSDSVVNINIVRHPRGTIQVYPSGTSPPF